MRHVAVTEGNRIFGVLRVNTALRRVSPRDTASSVTLRDIASRNFTIVREDDIVFDVIQRIWRKHAAMALVVTRQRRAPTRKRRGRDHEGACRRLCCEQCQGVSEPEQAM